MTVTSYAEPVPSSSSAGDSSAPAAARLWSEPVSITFTTTRAAGTGSSSAESSSSSSGSSGGARPASGGRASQQQRPRQPVEYEYAEYTDYETEPPPEGTSEPPFDEDTPAPGPNPTASAQQQQQQREQNEQGAGGERGSGSGRRTTGAPPSGQLRGPLPPVTEPLVNVRHDTSCVLRELHVSPAYLTGIDLRADLSWRLDTGTLHNYLRLVHTVATISPLYLLLLLFTYYCVRVDVLAAKWLFTVCTSIQDELTICLLFWFAECYQTISQFLVIWTPEFCVDASGVYSSKAPLQALSSQVYSYIHWLLLLAARHCMF